MKLKFENKLSSKEIHRYSRQAVIINSENQRKLIDAKVIIVGMGGLGSPCAMYLASAGIGTLGLIDYDTIEISNLSRQVIHKECDVGKPKSESAAEFVKNLNSNVKTIVHSLLLSSENALEIFKEYDVIVDCTDNVPTRYLLNDAAVILSKPLVSGGALRMEGQLTVYNHDGPCYRCIFPTPPPPETVGNCGSVGVIGAITGTIGSLQALQVIQIITGQETLAGKLLLFDGSSMDFRKIKLRGRQESCAVCGTNPTITKLIDYVAFCGSNPDDKSAGLKILDSTRRITVQEYEKIEEDHVLLDVREDSHHDLCSAKGSLRKLVKLTPDIPLKDLKSKIGLVKSEMEKKNSTKLFVVCVVGNDSQLAVKVLEEHGIYSKDIINGYNGFKDFPKYY